MFIEGRGMAGKRKGSKMMGNESATETAMKQKEGGKDGVHEITLGRKYSKEGRREDTGDEIEG